MANISSYLNTIRTAASGESVRTAIVNCLNAINRDNPVTVQGKTITANGTYTAEGGIAFNPVTVQVPTGGSDSYNFQDIKITENGEYQAEEENTYFDKVTVAVPQFANDLMEERKITKNGEYEALLDGYDGYAKVIVDVSGIDTDTFTCTFVDENGTPLRIVPNIPSGGWCSDNGLRPASATGLPFQGWNPAPNDIRYNIICRPTYYEPQQAVGEITDDWATIVANKGEPYPIGAYKTLPINITGYEMLLPSPDSYIVGGQEGFPNGIAMPLQFPVMMKVANGEDVSTSTWLSVRMDPGVMLGPIYKYMTMEKYTDYMTNSAEHGENLKQWGSFAVMGECQKRFGWSTSSLRYFLNSTFFNAIPDYIRREIVPVTKITGETYADSENNPHVDNFAQTRDAIWIPSVREIAAEDFYHHAISSCIAHAGIRYTEFNQLLETTREATVPILFTPSEGVVLRDVAPSPDTRCFSNTHYNFGHTYKGMRFLQANAAPGLDTYIQILMSQNSFYDRVPIGFCL